MPTISLNIASTGMQAFEKVKQGVQGIARAEQDAAKWATLRVKAQMSKFNTWTGGGPQGGGKGFPSLHPPHPGGHGGGGAQHEGGFFHALHGAGRATGGEFGHLAHRASAVGSLIGMGGFGIAIAAAGVGLNALVSSFEHAAEMVRATAERTNEYADKKFDAGEQAGRGGLSKFDSDAGGIRQLSNMGLLASFMKFREETGFKGGAASFASMGASTNRWNAALRAQQLGLGGDEAAKLAGNLPMSGYDPNAAGRQIAQQGLGRRITDQEYHKNLRDTTIQLREAYGGAPSFMRSIGKIDNVQNKMDNLGLDNIANGKALGAAQTDFAKASDPVGYATAMLQKESEKKAAILMAMAKAAGSFAEAMATAGKAFGGKGSYEDQAREEMVTNATAQVQSE